MAARRLGLPLPWQAPGEQPVHPTAADDRPMLDATGCETIEEVQARPPPPPPPCLPIVAINSVHYNMPAACAPQDLLSCLLLSEAVYKAAEGPPAAAAAALNALRSELPPHLAPLLSVQYSRRSAEHR